MRQLTSLDSQFLALETPKQTGHVAGLAILDASTTRERRPRRRRHPVADRRAPAAAAAAALAPPGGAAGARLPLLDRRPRLRPPLPRPRDRARPARRRRAARRAGRADRLAPAGPLAAALGALPDQRPRVGARRDAHQDPPRADRRACPAPRSWACCWTSSPRAARSTRSGAGARTLSLRGQMGMLARGLLGIPRYPLRALRAIPNDRAERRRDAVRSAAGRRRRRAGSRGPRSARSAAATATRPSSGRPSPRRRRRSTGASPPTAASPSASSALDEVKEVKNAYGCTVNDVIVSICAGAVRRWLVEHDELPDEPLVVQVPISVRTDEQIGHLRQPDHADERRRCSPTRPTRCGGSSAPTTRSTG